jgi:hypothetical protein
MNAPEPTPDAGAARARRRKTSTEKRRSPEQRVLLTVMPDGSFRAADSASRKILKERNFFKGQEVIGYLYRVRDGLQWRRAHALGTLLADHVEAFHGLNAHQALKKTQLDGNIACDVERIDLPAPISMTVERKVVRSLAFGEMDDAEFSAIFKQLCTYIAKTYFPDMDATAVEDMLNLMPQDPT